MLTITPIYAALIALLFLLLSARVIRYRRANRLSLGDEGDRALLQRMRAQANCAEYAPIAVLLLVLLELQGWPVWVVHLAGLTLLAGRVAHGYGFSAHPQIMGLRAVGMVMTLTMIALSALFLLIGGLV